MCGAEILQLCSQSRRARPGSYAWHLSSVLLSTRRRRCVAHDVNSRIPCVLPASPTGRLRQARLRCECLTVVLQYCIFFPECDKAALEKKRVPRGDRVIRLRACDYGHKNSNQSRVKRMSQNKVLSFASCHHRTRETMSLQISRFSRIPQVKRR